MRTASCRNHYHLILQLGDLGMSRTGCASSMAAYARMYNRRHGRANTSVRADTTGMQIARIGRGICSRVLQIRRAQPGGAPACAVGGRAQWHWSSYAASGKEASSRRFVPRNRRGVLHSSAIVPTSRVRLFDEFVRRGARHTAAAVEKGAPRVT